MPWLNIVDKPWIETVDKPEWGLTSFIQYDMIPQY